MFVDQGSDAVPEKELIKETMVSHTSTSMVSHSPTSVVSHTPTPMVSHTLPSMVSHTTTFMVSHTCYSLVSHTTTFMVSHTLTSNVSYLPTSKQVPSLLPDTILEDHKRKADPSCEERVAKRRRIICDAPKMTNPSLTKNREVFHSTLVLKKLTDVSACSKLEPI